MDEKPLDLLIVGAGISGISLAAHMKMLCPGQSFAILDRRDQLGGTWDLFRYPGVRSDSDMHTLGFDFEPWIDDKAIADGPAILAYLNKVVDDRGIRPHIRFGTKVVSAEWSSRAALWKVTVETAQGWQVLHARFLHAAAGYYDYDDPYRAEIPGLSDFQGQVVHPQFWPEGLDYAGKRVVVIGSGATAVTLVPAMAEQAGHVTMLQRTPTWMGAQPSRDSFANTLRRLLPARLAYRITRAINIRLHFFLFNLARKQPAKVAAKLTERTRKALGRNYSDKHFLPPYNPWDQRLCLVPDGDMFNAISQGRASVVTGHIDRVDATGITLTDGTRVEADIIVTATGLALTVAGKIDLRVDGEAVDWTQRWFYRGCMFSNLPNFGVTFGYVNASWTLRADLVSRYICGVLNEMKRKGAKIVVPRLERDAGLVEANVYDFSSGYIQRVLHLMPKSADRLPWRLNQNYLQDRAHFRDVPVDDGVLQFETVAVETELA